MVSEIKILQKLLIFALCCYSFIQFIGKMHLVTLKGLYKIGCSCDKEIQFFASGSIDTMTKCLEFVLLCT
jgi:hypothetical protein